MYIITEKIISSLLSSNFEIDCVQIQLTQQVEENPIVYSGPGTIYQDEHGALQLKAYHTIKDLKKELSSKFQNFTPGKLIGNENYFFLEAIDLDGSKWISENIWVSGKISCPTSSHVIKASLDQIKNITERKKEPESKSTLFMILPINGLTIPYNKKEDLPDGGWSLNKSVFEINKFNFEFTKLDELIKITVNSKNALIDDSFKNKLIEALSIIFGNIVNPIIFAISNNSLRHIQINSRKSDLPNKSIHSPIKHSKPPDVKFFKSFLQSYIFSVEKPYSQLFGYWHKVLQSWQGSVENMALGLVVSIEGIIKGYFNQRGLPDTEILKLSEEAKPLIKKMKIGGRIKDRLLTSLGQLKQGTPKAALSELSDDGLIPDDFVKTWVKLRNKSAHADEIKIDKIEFQKFLDQIHVCLTLFYLLLFSIIGYQGKYTDFSTQGWPDRDF